jgi:hypothetical protein
LQDASADGSVLLYETYDGAHPLQLLHRPSGRNTQVNDGYLEGFARSGNVVLFRSLALPYSLFRIDAATGVRTTVLTDELRRTYWTPDRSAVLLHAASGKVWLYFPESEELKPVAAQFGEYDAVKTGDDGYTFSLFDQGALLFVDARKGAIANLGPAINATPLPKGAGLLYSEASGDLWGWTPSAGKVALGASLPMWEPWQTAPTGVSMTASGAVLVVDGSSLVKLWKADAPVQTLAQGALRAELGPAESRLFLVRQGQAQGQEELWLREVATGSEKLLRTSTSKLSGVFSHDDRLFALTEQAAADNWYGSMGTVSLWNAELGTEVPLQPAPAPVAGGAAPRFHRAGSLLKVFFPDQDVRLYDTASGQQRYQTSRCVVPAEGEFSYWGPGDDLFYTPQGGYQGTPADLYAWDARSGQETKLGALVKQHCFVGSHVVFHDNQTNPFELQPGPLKAWNADTQQTWDIAALGSAPTCLQASGAVLVKDNEQQNPNLPTGAGPADLIHAVLGTQLRRTVATGVTTYAVRAGELFFTTEDKLCAAKLEASPPR